MKNEEKLSLEVLRASKCFDEVEKLLKNENGKGYLVSETRYFYHEFKPVELAT